MTILETVYQATWLQPTSLTFLFVLLPAFLFVYYAAPHRLRPAILLLESLGYYYLVFRQGGTGSILFLVGSVLVDYGQLRLMEYCDEEPVKRRVCVAVSVVKSLAIVLGYGFYTRWMNLPQLLGIQVFTLSGLSALLDAYHRKPLAEGDCYDRNIVRFALYSAFFPALYAGPLLPYEEFARQLEDLRMKPEAMLTGGGQFVQGLFKTGILGGSLYELYHTTSQMASTTVLRSWLHVFSLAAALYFMLSGFSDIAQGLGALFGITLPRNFYYPYQSRDMGDFFDRFNITVNSFFKKNIRFPGEGTLSRMGSILLVGMLAGLWFGVRANYLLWGLYLAVFILMEQYLYPKLLVATPMLFRRIFTLCAVLAGFTIFGTDTPAQSIRLIASMFRFSAFYSEQDLYLLSSNWLLLLLSVFFATNAVNLAVTKLRRNSRRLSLALFGGIDLGILLLYLMLRLS